LLVYFFYLNEDYNKLFFLLNKTKNLEYLALKAAAYLKINRPDLGEQTLKQMRAIDEDNVLTNLVWCWLNLHQANLSSQSYDSLISYLNEMGEKYGYSPKTYNLLALVLMLKSDYERALKIFESAV
jgi:tetratricopeptide (TPR) repeat protein